MRMFYSSVNELRRKHGLFLTVTTRESDTDNESCPKIARMEPKG